MQVPVGSNLAYHFKTSFFAALIGKIQEGVCLGSSREGRGSQWRGAQSKELARSTKSILKNILKHSSADMRHKSVRELTWEPGRRVRGGSL